MRLSLNTAFAPEFDQAQTAYLTFTTQKNGVENKVIRHFLSGNPYICAIKLIKRQVCPLRSHNVPLSMPLSHIYTSNESRTQPITPALITKTLRTTITHLSADLGFLAPEVSTRSL